MKLRNILIGIGLSTGVSYLAYKKISDELFKTTFLKRSRSTIVEQKYLDWISTSNVEQVSVESFDGLKLNAYDVHNNDSNNYLIMVHGIYSDKSFMYERAYEFSNRGFNCLLIDQRASGDSEGKYYTYGQKESIDLLVWIDYLIKKYPDVKITLYGVSMGAATIMMTTAYDLPDNVKCLVEDCGYSSIKEEFDFILRTEYKLAYTAIALKNLENSMYAKFGMKFSDVSPKTALDNNTLPIMFIHGEDDDVVPFEMSKRLYNHSKGERRFYPVPGALHCEANQDPKYYDILSKFINQYCQ